jgi:hypothetical protein
MGKAQRDRQANARAKIAAQQAAAHQAEMRRRAVIVGGAVVAVLAVVVAFVAVRLLGGTPAARPAKPTTATDATTISRQISTVSAATLDSVGAGPSTPAQGGLYPNSIQTITPAGVPLTSGGKPQIVYVGAEYCPYCAAERWALTVALSRFGTFSGLSLIRSSSTDVYPNTPTVSFYRATFTSKYLAFHATEAQTVDRAPLQPLTSLDKALMTKYDAPPYVPSGYSGSYPFIDFGNRYVIAGASYDPALLADLTWGQIAADTASGSGPDGTAIDATANLITAALCKLTNNQPANVCTSHAVTSASGSI